MSKNLSPNDPVYALERLTVYSIFEFSRYQWSEAIFNYLPSVPVQYVHHFTSGKDYVGNSKITIVSYDLLVRSIDVFRRRPYGFVILVSIYYSKNLAQINVFGLLVIFSCL